jgi:preprotein translocase subunit SecE
LVEQRSPKPQVGGSTPSAPAKRFLRESALFMAKTTIVSKNNTTALTKAVDRDAEAVAPRVSVAQYIRNIKLEIARVAFPTRKETMVTTLMVVLMVSLMAVFFFLVDQALSWGIKTILG